MIRPVLTELGIFLIPFALYALFLVATRNGVFVAEAWRFKIVAPLTGMAVALLLASFSLFSWPNATVTITLLLCAVAVSSAVFLILELDQPFDGIIQVPSSPLRGALEQLGK